MVNLKDVNNNSILVFEYFTSSNIENLSIISEAIELIKSLVIDLKDEDIYVLIAKQFKNIFNDLDFNVKTIIIEEDLENWLVREANVFHKTIFIAAEKDMKLYNLTHLLESKGLKIYGSESFAVKIASDKFETFNYLKNIVNQPRTHNIIINHKNNWKRTIQLFFNTNNKDDKIKKNKLITKPRFGVDCEDVKIISSKKDIEDIENFYQNDSQLIVQEYIPGDICSVSLLCDGKKALPISLNKQIIKIDENGSEYLGGYVNYNHHQKYKAFEMAKRICEFIPGLKGFVGVDLILSTDVHFIEINSRFTTPYINLQKVSNINIGKTILDLIDKKISIEDIIEIEFNNNSSFFPIR